MMPWKRALATTAVVTVTLDVLMVITGMGPSVILVATTGLLLGSGIWLIAGLSTTAVGTDGVPTPLAMPPPVRADRRVTRLRSGLAYGHRDDGSLERLRASLIELIDDQLVAVHDIDRHRDPVAARAMLGPDLDAFVGDEDSAQDLAKPRRLADILTRIEQL